MADRDGLRKDFAALHESGTFVVPNVWDVGSACVFESVGARAVATTSSGLAAALGRHDQTVTLEELVEMVRDVCARISIPVSVDSESGFSDTVEGLDATVARLDAAGAAGVSIEDYVPGRGILGTEEATERVARFVAASDGTGMVVTARAENHLYGHDDLDDTIARLRSFAGAGAHCVYAPGLHSAADIARVVAETGAPVNVLALRDGPGVPELTELGVRRVSIGGAIAFAAYGAAERAARELLERGTMEFATGSLSAEQRRLAFDVVASPD